MPISQQVFSLSVDVVKILQAMANGHKDQAKAQITELQQSYNLVGDDDEAIKFRESFAEAARSQAAVILDKVTVPRENPLELFPLLDVILNLLPDESSPNELQTQLTELVNQNQISTVIENAMQAMKDGEVINIGRNLDNTMVLVNYPNISRRHCSISRSDNQFYISDHRSHNGTFVGGEQLTSTLKQLNAGDIVSFGSPEPSSAILSFTVPAIQS